MTSRAELSFVAFAVAASVICIRLGVWQLDRRADRQARNEIVLAGRAKLPLDLTDSAPAEHRIILASGSFDFEREIVLTGRAFNGVPGVEVVTPLRLPGRDTVVLVDRGFIPSADAATIDQALHRDSVSLSLEGIAIAIPTGDTPVVAEDRAHWRRLDLVSFRVELPYPIYDTYILMQSPPGGGLLPRRLPPPSLDEGPHLNYAIQWFAFATIALVGAGAYLISKHR